MDPNPTKVSSVMSRDVVGEVMTPVVISISEGATLGEAAAQMTAHQVHGLPVISERRGLVGFTSSRDVTRWVARS